MALKDLVDFPHNHHLISTAAFDVRSNREKFNKASKQALEDDFIAWRNSAEILNELNKETIIGNQEREDLLDSGVSLADFDLQTQIHRMPYLRSPRYNYFIVVDQKALESVLGEEQNETNWFQYSGWVNLVLANLSPKASMNVETQAVNKMTAQEELDEGEDEEEEDSFAQSMDRDVVRISVAYLKNIFTESVDKNSWDREWLPPPLVRNGSSGGYDPQRRIEV